MIRESLLSTTRHLAVELASSLKRREQKIVFAESCTAGLTAALLAQVPGISQWLCGSMVTYQESAKQLWLGIDPACIHRHTAVSREVTANMAESVLQRTSPASFSVAVTGHLQRGESQSGPHAFVALGYRSQDRICVSEPVRFNLSGNSRVDRQWEAARQALNIAVEHLHFPPDPDCKSVDWSKICGKPANFIWNHWI